MGGFLRGRASAMPGGRARRVLSWLLLPFGVKVVVWYCVGGVYFGMLTA
jgi:hypothetical protein